jgi:hypothetical protein
MINEHRCKLVRERKRSQSSGTRVTTSDHACLHMQGCLFASIVDSPGAVMWRVRVPRLLPLMPQPPVQLYTEQWARWLCAPRCCCVPLEGFHGCFQAFHGFYATPPDLQLLFRAGRQLLLVVHLQPAGTGRQATTLN